jgi:hypothetical protein
MKNCRTNERCGGDIRKDDTGRCGVNKNGGTSRKI